MRHIAKALIGIAVLNMSFATTAHAADKPQASCDAPELFGKDDNDYNRLVCEGTTHMQRQQYTQAVRAFEAAMQKTLYDSPNFVLYPRLALAYLRAGDPAKARATLKKGEIALSIFIGAVKCLETNEQLNVIKQAGSDSDRAVYESPYWPEVSRRMCGAMYDIIYTQRSFTRVLGEAKLVQAYLDIKKEIETQK